MFLFCFIPSNKHGCLTYRSFKSFWITFVPPTASSIMSKLPELFYLSLFVNDFKHAFTYRGMYDLNKKKTKHGPNPHAGTTWVRLLRAVPKWVFLTGISQDGDSIISVDNLFQYLTVITVIFFFSLYPVQISDVMTHALCDSCPIAVHLWEKPGSFFSCIM